MQKKNPNINMQMQMQMQLTLPFAVCRLPSCPTQRDVSCHLVNEVQLEFRRTWQWHALFFVWFGLVCSGTTVSCNCTTVLFVDVLV